ncbi:MAG: tRNA (adenosine(37)-N6)-dimethylallyltransferase MiaA [Clostridia bacterium]|nr:tRNA (adenosine(37)-N6)-dimethylallyltransferase MiaA [Clostridia bacterium]
MKPLLIGIIGPTGVGKTNISVELALRLNGEIISTDSMQVYRQLNIGTAKISELETKGVSHHLINIINPDEPFSVADFQQLAKEKIYEISARGKLPFLVGGTGLYINALTAPYKFQEHTVNQSRRQELATLAEAKGNHFVHDLLAQVDSELAAKLHHNDLRRIIRGIEYYEATGEKISNNYVDINQTKGEFNVVLIGLTMERNILYHRIDARVDEMINDGLIEEVTNLLKQGYSPNLPALQSLGYKEIISYLTGKNSLEEAISLLKRNTRRFAKRQLTWFKRDHRIHWFNIDPNDDILKIIEKICAYIGRTTNMLVE